MERAATGEPGSRPPLRVRAPLASVAAAMVVGIVAGRYLPLPPAAWGFIAGLAFVVGLGTFVRLRYRLATTAAVLVCVLALSALHARLAWASVADDDIVTFSDTSPTLATVRGRVVTAPQMRHGAAGVEFGWRGGPQTSFLLRAERIKAGDRWIDTSGLLDVSVGQIDGRLAAAQQVELMGWLSRPRKPANPGQFDGAARARRTGVRARLSVPGSDGAAILANGSPSWPARTAWNLRAAAREHLTTVAEGEPGDVLAALLLGERRPALRTVNRAMVRTGVAHFLSISGLHLGIFLGFVYLICRVLTLTPRRSALAALAILAAYVLLAEPRAPLLRSAIMAVAVCLAVLFRRRLAALNALALAAIALLVWDPLWLSGAGFQLSFAIVGGILLFHEPLRRALFAPLLRRRGLMVYRDSHGLRRRVARTAADWGMHAVAMSVVAYLAAAPLVAYHFGLFSPYAPLLSLLMLPLVTVVLVPAYISMALATPMPNAAWQVGRLSAGAADWLATAAEGAARIPGVSIELRPLPAGWVALAYAALVLLAVRRRLPLGRVASGLAGLGLAALTVWTQLPAAAPDSAELHLLAVGGGQCAVLHAPGGRTLLVDAGTRSGYDVWETTLAPFLRERSLPAPRAAFVSHANTDHYNALPALLRRGDLRTLYINVYFGRGGAEERPEPPAAAAFLALAEREGAKVMRIEPGTDVWLDDRTSVEVLWPPPGRSDLAADANDTSLVLRVRCDGRVALVTGDIGAAAQTELTAARDVAADVLILPHHGSWERTLPAFVEAVNPRVIVVSAGREPRVPMDASRESAERREFLRRLRTAYRYYSTPHNGWCRIRFGRDGLDVHTAR